MLQFTMIVAYFGRYDKSPWMLFCTVILAFLHIAWACPEGCDICAAKYPSLNKTVALLRARCSHNPDMVTVPQDLPTNLGVLLFKSNNLKYLTTVSFNKFPYLQRLDLSNNRIEDIENGTFLKQRFLTHLVLQDNELTKLTQGMFHGLEALKELHLEKNSVSGLKQGVFTSLKSLRVLKLHDNDIERVIDGTFEGLDNLEELDLSGCSIKELREDSLGNLMSLKTINLSYNKIKTIDDQTFACTPLLKTLHINNNNLTSIPNIRWLEFLLELDASSNPISHIYTTTFRANHMLQEINLSFCQIAFLKKETVAGLTNLRSISLESNPLHCNCRIQWLHYWLETKTQMFSKANQILCKRPSRLEGKIIKNVKVTDLKCSCKDCKLYIACESKDEQCNCTSGKEYNTCEDICSSSLKTYNCSYANEKCICDSLTPSSHEPRQCDFRITNKTCSKNAQLQRVGKILDCVCSKGFIGDGVKCIDVDECASSFKRCFDENSFCYNTIGSFKCKCLPGYKRSKLACVDVNECEDRSICGEHGVCYNTQGSYRCECKEGFHRQSNKCYPLLREDQIHVTTQPLNSTAILIQWNISARKDYIADIRILYLYYGSKNVEHIRTRKTYTVNDTYGILTNLRPDATYTIALEIYMVFNATVKSRFQYSATTKNVSITMKLPTKSSSLNLTTVIISVVLTVVFTIVGCAVVFYCIVVKKRKARRENSENISSYIEERIELRAKDPSQRTSYSEEQVERKRSDKSVVLDAWEIPRSQLKIGEVIGEGHFGVVLQGTLTIGDNEIKVAVKTIKEADRFDMKDFMLEMTMMKEIGYHPNVVSLLGVSSIGAPLYIITEYVDGGNLLDLLRSSRHGSSNYANVVSSLNSRDLLNIALDVCKGMRHVASKKLVHRDLAARNVLMTRDLVAKIGDFGLARDVYCEGIYVKTGGGRLPIKWMAPESIKDRTYTVKSDVWSFGILMWEIVTLGGSPYPSMPLNTLLEKVLYGYRMPKPDHCSDEVYSIMEECWMVDPVSRPHFDFLCKELLMLLSEEDRIYINVTGLALEESLNEDEIIEEQLS